MIQAYQFNINFIHQLFFIHTTLFNSNISDITIIILYSDLTITYWCIGRRQVSLEYLFWRGYIFSC